MSNIFKEIASSERLKENFKLLEKLGDDSFSKLLLKMCQAKSRLVDDCCGLAELELQKFADFLGCEKREAELLVNTLWSMIKELLYYSKKADSVKTSFESMNIMSTSKLSVFLAVYERCYPDMVEYLSRLPTSPNSVVASNCRLAANCASSESVSMGTLTTFVDFRLNSTEADSKFTVEFNPEQLSNFYTQLEDIQRALDKLTQQ